MEIDSDAQFFTKTSLQIGDYVLLQLSNPNHGWLASEGLLDNDCFIVNEAENFDSCIWQIHVQNQYSAAREYKEALLLSIEGNEIAPSNNKNNKSADHLNQLQRTALNEQRLNDKLMNIKTGKSVAYGDPVQLRHVKSGKFLTISSSLLAKEERENMLVQVDQEGDSLSCVNFLPRYKYDREGQNVPNGAEIIVRVHERPGEYLHAAASRSDLDSKGEVNCSLESTHWTVTLYQRALDINSNYVLAGHLVTLQDPDSLMCITLERPFPLDTIDAPVVMAPNLKTNTLEGGEGTNLLWSIEKLNATTGGPISVGSDLVILRDLNSGRYLRIDEEGVVAVRHRTDASTLEFFLSPKSSNQITPLIEKDSSILICSEGLWFGQAEKSKNQVNGLCVGRSNRLQAVSLQLTCIDHSTSLINVHVGVQATANLRQLIAAAEDFERGVIPIKAFAMNVKASLSVLENVCSFLAMSDTSVSDEAIEIMGSSDKASITARQNMVREQGLVDAVLDVLELTEQGVFDSIQSQYARSQRGSKSRKSAHIDDPLTEDELDRTAPLSAKRKSTMRRTLLSKLSLNNTMKNFEEKGLGSPLAGGSSRASSRRRSVSGSDSSAKASEMALSRRMSMSAGFANLLEDDEEPNAVFKSSTDIIRESTPTSQQMAQKCLKVLLCLVVNNFATQLYVADRLPIVLNQVKDHKLAVHCVEELLKENLTVLQTKVREREIDIFVNLLGSSEMSVTFLKLIQSTCSCPMGVDATQRMVTYALFGHSITELERSYSGTSRRSALMQSMSFKLNVSKIAVDIKPGPLATSRNLVMKLSANRENLTPVTWKDFSVYCPEDPMDHVLGYAELSEGLPEIYVSWTMRGIGGEYSMESLFGTRDKVPLMSVCAAARATLISRFARGDEQQGKSGTGSGRRKPSILMLQKKKPAKTSMPSHVMFAGLPAATTKKTQVAEYLNTQLFLVADLCLDRNYVAIGILETMYEYDLLVTMLKMEMGIPSKFKAAACRILRTMYIDREPHVAAKFPQYIRTSVSLAEEADYYSDGEEAFKANDHYKFALIQQIIADYVNEELDPHNCDELSAEMMDLLFALVSFGFYVTSPQILEVLRPLVRILDEHQKVPAKRLAAGFDSRANNQSSRKSGSSKPRNKIKSSKVAVSTKPKNSLIPGDSTRKMSPSAHMFEHVKESIEVDNVAQWRKDFLALTESVHWSLFTIYIVIASIVLVFYQILTRSNQFDLYLASTAYFAFDVIMRMMAYNLVYPKLRRFFYDPFNIMDICMVIFDIILLSLDSYANDVGAGRTARSIRIIRVLRLIRVFPVVNAITHITHDEFQAESDGFVTPSRYHNIQPMEARTIVNILKILSMFYDRILDKKLDLAVKAFSQWCDEIKKKKKSDPVAILNKMLNSEESITTELSSKFDSVLLDVVMYSDTSLTQHALQLLMVHKSHKDQFLQIAEKIQIVYSPRIEAICKNLTQMVRDLKSLAEMFEIWCDLESEEDQRSAHRCGEILGNIKGYLTNTNDDRTLGMRSIVLVDEEVQHILRNLDAMTAFMALLEALYDGGREELRPQVEEIMRSCCDLICWFMKSLDSNQMVAFKNIGWFMELIDAGINSSSVVRIMLEGNHALIKQCPRRYLNECAQKIVLSGRKPEYLDLFVGMTEFSRFALTTITGVEAEISSYLTAREWKEHVLLWCCSYDSEDYRERKKAMQKVSKNANGQVTEDDLTPDLKYHLRILVLLANCNLGPKIHAIYPVQDLLHAIVDPDTIFPVKKALSNLLVEVVKSSIDRVEKSDSFWQLLEDMALTLETLPTDYVELSRSPILRIQRGEWIEIIASLIVSFFEGYDFALHQESREKSIRNHSADPRVIIDRLYKAIKTLVEYHGAKLGNVLLDELSFALSSLSLHVDMENLELGASPEHDEEGNMNEAKLRIIRLQHQRASIIYADVQQVFFRKQFGIFLRTIKEITPDSRCDVVTFLNRIPWIKDGMAENEVRFEPLLKKLSTHFRSMIKRSATTRTLSGDSEQVVETCEWLLRSLRHQLEHEMKATFDNITDVDIFSVGHTSHLHDLCVAFNANGITYLCLDLICIGIEPSVRSEAMRLLIVMLLRNPLYSTIQQTIYTYLLETDSTLFFETVREMIENMKSWSTKENESEAVLLSQLANQVNHIPDDITVLYLLQALCEGEDCRIRDQIREQKGNSKVVNIIEAIASFVGILSHGETMSSAYVMSVLLRVVLRLVQGPCKGNQENFVLNSELLMALNRVIRALRPANLPLSAIWSHYLEEVKEHLVEVLRGLIEGQAENSLVFDRVSSTIDVGVLHILILANKNDDSLLKKNKSPSQFQSYMKSHGNEMNQLTKAQAKYLVLTQTLGRSVENYQSLSRVDNIEKNIAHVDIVWNQRVETVHFPIPAYVKELTTTDLNEVVENMDDVGASREMKLADFLTRCKGLYQRLLHQQLLKKYGLSDLFTIKYYLVRFMFVNALVMSILLLVFYGTTSNGEKLTPANGSVLYYTLQQGVRRLFGEEDTMSMSSASRMLESDGTEYPRDPLYMAHSVHSVLDCLNIIQIICAIFILLILSVVELPVTFCSALEKHKIVLEAVYYTLQEPLPIWYIIYLTMTLLAFWVNRTFITVLLLDWVVLDPTTQDVLLAIRYPVKQLIATLIIIVIVLNIFSSVVFVLYRDHVTTFRIVDLWDALKLCISYGFRGEYGVDHEMDPTLGERMVLDVVFYIVVLSILRHIFFAIIVDTFGKLRELKMERENEALNTCFICGIERHEYDRIVSPGTGLTFVQHRLYTHNTASYIYFILNIWQQNPSEDSSLEIFVRNCLAKKDVSWLPTGILQQEILAEEAVQKQALGKDGSGGGLKSGLNGSSGGPGGGGGNGGNGGGGGKTSKLLSLHAKSGEINGNNENHMELLDKMNLMQKQLYKITKSLSATEGGQSQYQALPSHPQHNASTASESPAYFESPKLPSKMALAKTSSPSENPSTSSSFIVTQASSSELYAAAHAAVTKVSGADHQVHVVSAVPTEPMAVIMEKHPRRSDPPPPQLTKQPSNGPSQREQTEKIMECLSNLGSGLTQVMDRLEKLEKKFIKSHKYLRQRIDQKASSTYSMGNTLGELGDSQTEEESSPKKAVRSHGYASAYAMTANTDDLHRSKSKNRGGSSVDPVVQQVKSLSMLNLDDAPIKVVAEPGQLPRVTEQRPRISPRAAEEKKSSSPRVPPHEEKGKDHSPRLSHREDEKKLSPRGELPHSHVAREETKDELQQQSNLHHSLDAISKRVDAFGLGQDIESEDKSVNDVKEDEDPILGSELNRLEEEKEEEEDLDEKSADQSHRVGAEPEEESKPEPEESVLPPLDALSPPRSPRAAKESESVASSAPPSPEKEEVVPGQLESEMELPAGGAGEVPLEKVVEEVDGPILIEQQQHPTSAGTEEKQEHTELLPSNDEKTTAATVEVIDNETLESGNEEKKEDVPVQDEVSSHHDE
eukprot:gene8101-8940_t